MKLLLCTLFVGSLSACVAPEAPVVRSVTPPVTQAPSRVGFEDAPLPNRKLAPTSDSIIRLAH